MRTLWFARAWDAEAFNLAFASYNFQLEVQVETYLKIGPTDDVYRDFGNRTLRWVNPTVDFNALLIVPVADMNSYSDEFELALRFLAKLTFRTGAPNTVLTTSASSKRLAPILLPSKRDMNFVFPADFLNCLSDDPRDAASLAYGLYQEGKNSAVTAVPYGFLCFYKVLQLLIQPKKSLTQWINTNVVNTAMPDQIKRIQAEPTYSNSIAEYLYASCRCAIAHVGENGHKPVASPLSAADRARLAGDVWIVERLAKLAIHTLL
jgi:hypothetical protein